jgi:hypothetical protein
VYPALSHPIPNILFKKSKIPGIVFHFRYRHSSYHFTKTLPNFNMSTVQTPPNEQTGSIAINNDGEVLEEAAGVGPVSNDNNDQADATQVQTSSQGNNNASRGSRPHKPKSKRGKYISKAW